MNINKIVNTVKGKIHYGRQLKSSVFLSDEEMHERGLEYQMSAQTYREMCEIFASEVRRMAVDDAFSEEDYQEALERYVALRTKTHIYMNN